MRYMCLVLGNIPCHECSLRSHVFYALQMQSLMKLHWLFHISTWREIDVPRLMDATHRFVSAQNLTVTAVVVMIYIAIVLHPQLSWLRYLKCNQLTDPFTHPLF